MRGGVEGDREMKNKLTNEQIEEIMKWCFKNNAIEFKNTTMRLAILDGGWVNVIKLEKFLKELEE